MRMTGPRYVVFVLPRRSDLRDSRPQRRSRLLFDRLIRRQQGADGRHERGDRLSRV